MRLSLILLVTLTIFFSACKKSQDIYTQDFQISLPKEFIKTNQIVDSAEIQYYYPAKNIYLAVEKIKSNDDTITFLQNNIYSLFDNVIEGYEQKIQLKNTNAVTINILEGDNYTQKYWWEITVCKKTTTFLLYGYGHFLIMTMIVKKLCTQ